LPFAPSTVVAHLAAQLAYHLCAPAPAVGLAYTSLQLALYTLVPLTVWLLTSVYSALVTTLLTIHVLQGTCVVTPLAGPTDTAVVSGHAPDHTVGPGITYSVAQGVVEVLGLRVSVEQ
jgi:hypothetical protein